MNCQNCQAELPINARFCPNCGAPVARDASIRVQQDVGKVSGEVIGAILGNEEIPSGLDSNTDQRIDTVESGGSVVGTILGGEGNVHVGGKQQYGDTVQNKREVNTGGGAYVGGAVNTGGGDFIGRDQQVHGDIVHGSNVGGDQYSVGDIVDSQGVAIGRGAQATVTTGLTGQDIDRLFSPLEAAVSIVPPDKRAEALKQVEALKDEVAKGKQADDSRIAKLLDGLVALAPGAVSAAVSAFASPILAGIAGPVTKYVLDRIQGK